MCSPQTIQPNAPKGASRLDERSLPTAWFLADVLVAFPHKGVIAGGHVYISRTEDGWYRVLHRGTAFVVSEGVAARHLRRCKGSDGRCVRISRQAHWDAVWAEIYWGGRRAA